jgi:hypothetical protein
MENFGHETIVNERILLQKGAPAAALNPDMRNTIGIGDLKLEVYCRDAYSVMHDFDPPTLSRLRIDEREEQSLTTSIMTSKRGFVPAERTEFLYIFKHRVLESRNRTRKLVALDPWSCHFYVAKRYPLSDRGTLEERLGLFDNLPVNTPCLLKRALLIEYRASVPLCTTSNCTCREINCTCSQGTERVCPHYSS